MHLGVFRLDQSEASWM